jgi:hypothetical protein
MRARSGGVASRTTVDDRVRAARAVASTRAATCSALVELVSRVELGILAVGRAREQHDAELLLERLEPPAHRRDADPELRGRLADAGRAIRRQEHLEVIPVEHRRRIGGGFRGRKAGSRKRNAPARGRALWWVRCR